MILIFLLQFTIFKPLIQLEALKNIIKKLNLNFQNINKPKLLANFSSSSS